MRSGSNIRFPLSLRMADELLAARGIAVSHETIRQWAPKFGQAFANQIRLWLSNAGDKWHLDEVALTISGVKTNEHGDEVSFLYASQNEAFWDRHSQSYRFSAAV